MRRAAIVLVVFTLVLPACRRSGSSESAGGAESVGVTVEIARAQTIRLTANGPGTIVPSASGDWVIHATELGRLAQILKREGEAVDNGDPLVRFEYGSAGADSMARAADIAAANNRLEAAKQQLARVQSMVDRGFASRAELDNAKSAVTTIELEISRHQRALEAANLESERAVVKARFKGVVAKVFHQEGEIVNASGADPVMRIIDPTKVEAVIAVPIDQAAQVQPGQTATVISLNGMEPATVLARPPATDPKAPTQEVRLTFPMPTTLPMDSPIQGEVLIAERPAVIAMPSAAVRKTQDGGAFVLVAGDDGFAHRRDVRLGLTAGDRIEILTGVSAGERVIVKSDNDVNDGTAVTPDR